MSSNNNSANSWLQALLLVAGMILVMMKATGNLDWEWWVVLIPLYPIIFAIGVALIVIAFMIVIVPIALLFGAVIKR